MTKETKSLPEKSSEEHCIHKITVEPVIFCYAFGIILHVPVIQQYIHRRIAEEKGIIYNTTASLSNCDSMRATRNGETLKIDRNIFRETICDSKHGAIYMEVIEGQFDKSKRTFLW